MLVRNNTACPHCGKLSATDLYVRTDSSCLNLNFWTVVVECYDCLSIEEYQVHQSVLRGWIRLLVLPGDPVERWSPNWTENLSVQQKDSLLRSFDRILPRGGVDNRSSDFPPLWRIIRYLRRSIGPIDGSTFESFSRAWSCL
jgi:hypothetical protein